MTVSFDTTEDGFDRTNRPGDWQVIFKTVSGQDYCRETVPGKMSREAIMKWAERQVAAHNLGGAIIERW